MNKHLGTAVAIVVGLLAFAGAKWAVQGGISAFQQSESNVSQEFDEYAGSDPMMQSFAETYPAEWAEFRSSMIAGMREEGVTAARMAAQAHAHTRAFMLGKVDAMTLAPDTSIINMLRADGAFLRHLREVDVTACAIHASQGLGPEAQLTPEGWALLSASGRLRLQAARAGETNPVTREEVSEADGNALNDAMLATGLTQDDVNAMYDGSVDQASPQAQCDVTVGIYDGLDTLPEPQASRLYAAIIEGAAQAL